jgi:phosphohistidine phosphatase
MKTLLLMRHTKSSWKDPELADHERPLNKRGKRDAPFMGELLAEKELLPQIILGSTAMRVRQTIEGLVAGSHYPGEIVYLDSFYLAEPETYLAELRVLPDTIERAMVIGHNPGLEGLLQLLSGRIESLPTGAVAYVSLPVPSWTGLHDQTEGELIELLRPKEAREAEESEKEPAKKDQPGKKGKKDKHEKPEKKHKK